MELWGIIGMLAESLFGRPLGEAPKWMVMELSLLYKDFFVVMMHGGSGGFITKKFCESLP